MRERLAARDLMERMRAGERVFREYDFHGEPLSGLDLSGCDFRGCSFCRAKLRGTRLGGADLAGAEISAADFGGAYMAGADLTGASGVGAKFNRAILTGARFVGAHIVASDFSGTVLDNTDFSRATLDYGDFDGARGRNVGLSTTRRYGTFMEGSRIERRQLPDPDGTERFEAARDEVGAAVERFGTAVEESGQEEQALFAIREFRSGLLRVETAVMRRMEERLDSEAGPVPDGP